MKARTRSRIDMGRRALAFSRGHPDGSPGYTAAVSRLEERLARCDALADQQIGGMRAAKAATARKQELRRQMLDGHLRHLVKAAKVAASEMPELAERITLPEHRGSYIEFQSAARSIAAEAAAQKEVLVRHGLVESVLEDLVASIGRFEQAMAEGMEARAAHVGASAELDTIAGELVALVHVLDGLNRTRFVSDPESLAAWRSASNIVDVVRTPAPADGAAPGTGQVQAA